MAIPTAKIPQIRVRTQIAPLKIYQPKVPSIDLLGTSRYKSSYNTYLEEQKKRSAYFFDYNNKDQVNSAADVVMNTISGLWDTVSGKTSLGDTLKQTMSDSWSLVNHGILEPVANKDWAALGINQLVNVGETVDIVDNVWKGLMIGGAEGARKAAFERVNYEWDSTGNFALDLGKELILSPTNLALLFTTMGAGNLAKEAVQESGEALSKKVVKSFAKSYTGDMASTVLKMQRTMNVTTEQVDQLMNVARHATNLKLLKSVNNVRTAVNFIDDLGPKLTYGTTFLPFKEMIKFGFRTANMPLKYMAHQFNKVQSEISVVNLIKESSKYGVAIKTMADAARLAGEDSINIAPYENVLADVAANEVRQFKALYRDFSKTAQNRELIYNLIEQEQYIRGQAIGFEVAQRMHISNRSKEFVVALNAKAIELSGGAYQTFDEYAAALAKIYHSDISGVGIEPLYEYTQNLLKITKHASSEVIADVFTMPKRVLYDIDEQVRNTLVRGIREGKEKIEEDLGRLSRLRSRVLKEFKELYAEYAAGNVGKKDELRPRLNELKTIHRIEMVGKNQFVARNIDNQILKLDGFLKDESPTGVMGSEAYFKVFENRVRMTEKLSSAYETAIKRIDELKEAGTIPEDWANKVTIKAQVAQRRLRGLAYRFRTAENFQGFYDQYMKISTGLSKDIDNITGIFSEATLKENTVKFAKRILGDSGDGVTAVQAIMTRVEESLGAMRKQYVAERVNIAYDTKMPDILATLDELKIALNDSDIGGILQTMSGDGISMPAVYDELAEVLSQIDLLLKVEPSKESLTALLDNVNRVEPALKSLRAKITERDLKYGVTSDPVEVNKLLNALEPIKTLFHVDPTIEIKYTDKNIREYQLKLNAVYRNLMIMNTETVQNMLDMLDGGTFAYDEALQTIDAVAHFDLSKWTGLITALQDGNDKIIDEMYSALTDGQGVFPLGDALLRQQKTDAINQLYDEVKMLKDSALNVMDTLSGMASARRLYSLIESQSDVLGDSVSRHLLDALQWYYDAPATLTSSGSLKETLLEIKNNINNQLRNSSNRRSFKLENWREDLPEEVGAQYDALFPGNMSHTAIADSYAEYLVRKHILNKTEEPNVKLVYSDLETSTKNRYGSAIHQQSVVIPETGVFRWYINTGVGEGDYASDEVLAIMFDSAKPSERKYATSYLRELYEDIHIRGNVDRLKNHFNIPIDSPIEIIPVRPVYDALGNIIQSAEANLLRTTSDYIKRQAPAQGELRIAMYNGKDFDATLISSRARTLGVSTWINKERISDTRIELEAFYNVERLNKIQEDSIDEIVQRYVNIRDNELITAAARRQLSLDQYFPVGPQGKFLPTVDASFRDSLRRINDYFAAPLTQKHGNVDGLAKKYDVHTNLFLHRSTHPSLKGLNDFTRGIGDSIQLLGETQDKLGELHLYAAELGEKEMFKQRLVDSDFFKDINPKIADKYNIGIDVMMTNRVDGVYIPVIGVKTLMNHNLIVEWFDLPANGTLSRALAQRMTKAARNINRTVDDIQNSADLFRYVDRLTGTSFLDGARAMAELKTIRQSILDEITEIKGATYLSPILTNLKPRANLIEEYAITLEIWRAYKKMVLDMQITKDGVLPLFSKLYQTFPDRMLDLNIPRRVMYSKSSELNSARSFKLEPPDVDMKEMLKYYDEAAALPIDTLEKFEKLHDGVIGATRHRRMIPVYRKLYETFQTAQEIAENTTEPELSYTYLRMPMEAMNEIIAYQKLLDVLGKSPSSMASYLWHRANGIITFKESDLVSASYFKKRNNIKAIDVLNSEQGLVQWGEIMKNKAAYEAEGIHFKTQKGRVYMYLKGSEVDLHINRGFEAEKYDFDVEALINKVINNYHEAYNNLGIDLKEVRRLIKSSIEARHHLLSMTPEGMTSTLEHMDAKVMSDILKQTGDYLPGAVSVDTLRANSRFDGNMYNHTVLGSIDGRRELMPYASFIPAKTMFYSAELAHDRISKQMQFTMLLEDPLMSINHLTSGMQSNDEVFRYLKNAPHLKVAFLQANKHKGYKISAVTLNTPKDIDFARSVNAVILDRNTYVKAYEVINQNKIPEGLAKFLEHAIIAPFKIGWMAYNIGTVMRNFVDSGLKNVQSTGDLRIIPEMGAMFKEYWRYKQDIRDVLRLAGRRDIKLDEAIEEYFSQGAPRTSRQMFNLIDEFKKSGSSSGMVKEMQEYYGDSIQKLYRKVGEQSSGLSPHEFRELMRMADDEAATYLSRIPDMSEAQIRNALEAKGDLYFYKRAYEMHKRKTPATKHLSVEDFVIYLKRGNVDGFIPQDIAPDITKLMDATKDVSVKETMFEKFMANPLVDNALTWNGGVEEVMRLSMFKFLREDGHSVSEAMAEIIRTHFDYGHKTQAQMWLEMIAPFSTFRINSFLYWVDALSKSSTGMEIVAKYWKESSNISERDPEDYYLRRGLQYQMLSGNPVLNNESGLTLKLSPSVMDALAFVRNPGEYALDALFMVDEVKYFLELEPYENETAALFKERKLKAASSLVPVVGTWVKRAIADNEESVLRNLLLSPLVNRTWTPEQRVEKSNFRPRFYYADKKKYPKRSAKRARVSSYSPFNKIYYGAMYRMRNGIPHGTRAFRNVNRWHRSSWSRTMSSKHKQKYALLSFPTNKYTLKMKTQLLRRLVVLGK